MAKTADVGHDGDSAKDVGRQLRHVRRKQGLSRSEVARSAGLTRRELAADERGKQSVPESDLWCLAGSCGVDVGDLLPERPPVQVNSDSSLLAIGDSIRYLRSPVEDDELLRQYLAMIYELRNVPPGSAVPLRERDLVALADALGGSPERIESRLVELIGMSHEEAARLRAMILPPLSLGAGTEPNGAGGDAPLHAAPTDVFHALTVPEFAPGDGAPEIVDFFSAPRSPDPFDAPPSPELAPEPAPGWAPELAPELASAAPPERAHEWAPDLASASPPEPFGAPLLSVDPFAAPHRPEGAPITAPPPVSPPIAGPPPVTDTLPSWPLEGILVEAEVTTADPVSGDPVSGDPVSGDPVSGAPSADAPWDAAAAADSIVDPWAAEAPLEPGLPEMPPSYPEPEPEPAPIAESVPAPPFPEAPVPPPSTEFLAPTAVEAIVPVPPAFDAFAMPSESAPLEVVAEPAATPVDVPADVPAEIEPITALSIVDPFGDDDAGRATTLLAPEPPTVPADAPTSAPSVIAWAPGEHDEDTAPTPTGSTPEFERANSNWRVGGIFPATATADDGALALRRADARWALANLRATKDFTIEANVDFSAGAGFGVLFRASVDDSDRVTGYSFDVDPIASGGGYLVRQWIDNRQHWRPIANAPVTDPAMLYGRHTISLTMRADQLTVLVDGEAVLTIPALSRSSIEVGREPCRGDRIGIQAWATTEVTIDSFRIARY